MPTDEALWAAVRSAYCDTKLSVRNICAQFSISPGKLYERRETEDWPKRGAPTNLKRKPLSTLSLQPPQTNQTHQPDLAPIPASPTTPALPKPSASRATRGALIVRLYHAIDLKLTQMETLMASANETSSADHERETRALAGLIRNFERVTELQSDHSSSPKSRKSTQDRADASERDTRGGAAPSADPSTTGSAAGTAGTPHTTNAASAELLRRDIASRLDRIMAHRDAPGKPGPTE